MINLRGYLLLCVLVIGSYNLNAQCLVNSLVINTGYDPLTSLAIPGGANGGTPVPDPHWIVTVESPSIATAIVSTGLIEVVPGASADIITRLGGWISNPAGIPGGWLSCINSNTYNTDGTGTSGTPYNMTISRPFRLCSEDSITLDFYIANDNYISSTDIDGSPLLFSQPPLAVTTNFTTFTHFTQTVFLTSGTHTINVVVNNYNDVSVIANPSGMDIYGTVSSATGTNSLVSESYLSCYAFPCSSTCNSLSLPDTMHPCAGTSIVLPATIVGTDSILNVGWTPPAGLSDTTILDPTLTAGWASSWYYITLRSLNPYNWVVNGDFNTGNYGFTSSYTYSSPPSSVLIEGHYSVYTNPFGVHTGFTSMSDHTTGTGEMMIINGGPVPTDVWCETIPVSPNTDYDFSAWIANCSSVTTGADVPIMQFKINGVLIGTPTTISSAPGVWVNFFSVWNSGLSTTATICIYDANTASSGNDFALDDISFRKICVAKDSVYIDIAILDTTYGRHDTTLCITAAPITLSASPGYTSYLWNTGATTTTLSATAAGAYWVYDYIGCATLIDTFHVNYIPLPVVSLGNDTGFCIGNAITLSSIQPAGTTYLWSDGSSGDSIVVSLSGSYWLQLNNGCTAADSIHVVVSPFPFVNLGPDTLNCFGDTILLQSSGAYTAPSYLWSDASIDSTFSATVTGSYWLQVTENGCSATDTINVTIKYDTFILVNRDTAICQGRAVQVFLYANPEATFQWLPTAGIRYSTVASPLITPDTSALYTVDIYMTGCPVLKDSFYLDVQPNPLVHMGGDRQVCEFDTLHLYPAVAPAWYTHYFYHWYPGDFLDDTTRAIAVFTAGETTMMNFIVTTSAGCIGGDSAQVIVRPGNFAKIDSDFSICPHDSVQLRASGGTAYRWIPGMYLDDSTSATPWVRAITTLDYTLIATSLYGCLDTLSAHIITRPAAVIYLGDSVTLFPGESYQISPQTNCVNFAWFPPAGLDKATISNPLATPELSTKYIVTGTTEWGCKTKDSISIYLDPSNVFAIPNAFTPGGTVNNRLFIIRRGTATLRYFNIFNRWGNKVYESTNIGEGWDGAYKGKPQPFDVYVYELEATGSDGQVFHKHGNVTLIR